MISLVYYADRREALRKAFGPVTVGAQTSEMDEENYGRSGIMKLGKYWHMAAIGLLLTVIALAALCGLVWLIVQGG